MDNNYVIIYSETNTNDNISVIWRVDNRFTLHETAKRSVPTGHKYKFLKELDLPTHDSFQSCWLYDFENSFDGIGGISDIEWDKILKSKNL